MAQTIVVPNVGKGAIASLIAALTSNQPKYIGFGTGVHTAAVTDTDLTAISGSRIGTNAPTLVTTTVTNDTVQVIQTFTNSSGSVIGITEAGLFDASTSGNMFISSTFDVVNLQPTDQLQLTVQLKVS